MTIPDNAALAHLALFVVVSMVLLLVMASEVRSKPSATAAWRPPRERLVNGDTRLRVRVREGTGLEWTKSTLPKTVAPILTP